MVAIFFVLSKNFLKKLKFKFRKKKNKDNFNQEIKVKQLIQKGTFFS